MARKTPRTQAKRLVWRIDDNFPQGAFVDPDAEVRTLAERAPVDPEVTTGWMVSSFDLLHGTDITEGPETVPSELFDELFPAEPASRDRQEPE